MTRPEKKERVKLVFADDLTAATFDRMRDRLAEALIDFDRIEFELGNIRDVDKSLVELMCSAHRVSDSLGKSFTFGSAETNRKIQELACDSGYADFPCKYRTSDCLFRDGSVEISRMGKR